MTAQIPERLIFEGIEHAMCSNPLHDYFALGGPRPDFCRSSSACWRGYVGTWEVIEGRLYLIALTGRLNGGEQATIETVFPGYQDRVFAHWMTDTVRLPQGKLLEYVHLGYGSTYERDLLLQFKRGELIGRLMKENGRAKANAPVGYSIAASTSLGNSDVG